MRADTLLPISGELRVGDKVLVLTDPHPGRREDCVRIAVGEVPDHGAGRSIRPVHVSLWSWRDRVALAAGAAVPCLAAAIMVPLRATLPSSASALAMVVVIVAVAAGGNRAAGWTASISAAAWFDFFLTAPYNRFAITHRPDIETTACLLVVGVALTELAMWGRRQRAIASTDASALQTVLSSATTCSSRMTVEDLIARTTADITSLLGASECRFEHSRFSSSLPRLEPDGRLRFESSYWDIDQYGFPRSSVELLAVHNDMAYGRFIVTPTPGTLPRLAARHAAAVVAALTGSALAGHSATHPELTR